MDISIPSLSNMPPASAQNMLPLPSTDMGSHRSPSSLRLPLFYMAAQTCTGRDEDLSHLNHCLHHIVMWRTSSPILTDRTTRQQGSSHGNGTIYNLQVNGIQCLGSSTTTQHKVPDAPLNVDGQDSVVCQKTETLPMISEDSSPVPG